ncbi:hypothetical protein HHL22_06545 [Hymenobacter sp. RP-2-7]|uniref:DUF2071 domain-containing protein n=1 Tax=Hymenobacter polaris TaxID=2682546 RepID=A0A7Y0FLW9_9BACT|nr:DUF2071 domain-containing protein [Hymenobacter polaris]NML64861.1 hypothetical protein [Hymenobacter polaris]
MLSFLKSHPFAVEAFFDQSLVLTYAVPVAELAPLLPPCLAADAWQQQWGFVAVALVQTRHLRPQGWPTWLGRDFYLIGYRLFVRYTTAAGRRLRGLYILRSETDQKLMELAGNLFTHYCYHTVDIAHQQHGAEISIRSHRAAFQAEVHRPAGLARLPAGSPFSSWQQARRFAGPLPFTFSYDAPTRRVLLIEGMREHWQPQPVEVTTAHVGFLKQLPFSQVQLASAFVVENIPYHWQKGRTEQWQPHP